VSECEGGRERGKQNPKTAQARDNWNQTAKA
jgi:hypothetical protein